MAGTHGAIRATDPGGAWRRIQKRCDVRGRNCLAEQVTLPFGAAIGLEVCKFLQLLDTFGGCRQAKTFRNTQDRADDNTALRALFEARHEAPVDLDLIEMKGEQLTEGRIARAEIIERYAHAGLPELVDHGLRDCKDR